MFTCLILSLTWRGRMDMKSVQSKKKSAIAQPPLWVGICLVKLVRDEIVQHHHGTLAKTIKTTFENNNVLLC